MRSDAPDLFDGLTSGGGLAMVVVSALAGAATIGLVCAERYGVGAPRPPRAAVVAIIVGWALAQDPYLLPRRSRSRTRRPRRDADRRLVIIVGLGMIILGPSLWFLYRLVLQGRLDQTYEPLDQRFRPECRQDP